jgi:hypothetical protein
MQFQPPDYEALFREVIEPVCRAEGLQAYRESPLSLRQSQRHHSLAVVAQKTLTYPLQFATGALMNTAGSANDFVGGTNGYGNVECNGLPAISNGYIVDGLESNDPLTNLNSGLSTNAR